MGEVYIGLDTSNYKTSISALDGQGEVLFQRSEFLEVKKGTRGLRQSDAFFMHSNRLPDYISELFDAVDPAEVCAVGVSDKPRRVEGSYMPCFLAGLNAAKEIASALRLPVYTFSHQEGHAAAVLGDESSDVIFMHLSGGTTEFLLCRPDESGYEMSIAGGTRDISIGQLLDRAGVAMGLEFPSGRYLDEMAWEVLEPADFNTGNISFEGVMPRIRTEDGYFNLSGAETRLLRYIENNKDDHAIKLAAAEVFVTICRLLTGSADELASEHSMEKVYMAGGVASSRTLRELIRHADHKAEIIFGDPLLSGDNAVGTALLTKKIRESE